MQTQALASPFSAGLPTGAPAVRSNIEWTNADINRNALASRSPQSPVGQAVGLLDAPFSETSFADLRNHPARPLDLGGVSDPHTLLADVNGRTPEQPIQLVDARQNPPLPELQTNQTNQPQPQTQPQPTAQQPPGQTQPQPLTLNNRQQQVVNGVFQAQGNAQILDQPGNGNGRINAGDIVRYTNQAGEVVQRPLTAQEAYNINFRTNLIARCEQDPPWRFNGNTCPTLYNASGNPVNQNDFWERVETRDDQGRPTGGYLRLRPGVSPSAAVQDMFNNPSRYGMDCATATRMMNLAATMDTIGTQDFDRMHQGGLNIAGAFDSQRNNTRMGFETASNRPQRPNRDWERWTGPGTDPLIPGEYRYYENPNDTTTDNQGWNCIYLGTGPGGEHRFWAIGMGNPPGPRIRTDRTPGTPGTSTFGSSFYLSTLVGRPPTDLATFDVNPGPDR